MGCLKLKIRSPSLVCKTGRAPPLSGQPTACHTRKWSNMAHQSIAATHSLSNAIGGLACSKAGSGGANCRCCGSLILAQWALEKLRLLHPREVVIALLLTTLTGTLTSLWLTSLGMENAMAPRYLISGGPGLGTPFITYLLPGGGGSTPSFLRSPLLSSNPCAVSRFTAARVFNSLGPLLALSFLCNSLSVVFSVFRLTRSETSHVSSSSCILPPLSKMMPARSFLEPPWKPESSVVELPQPS